MNRGRRPRFVPTFLFAVVASSVWAPWVGRAHGAQPTDPGIGSQEIVDRLRRGEPVDLERLVVQDRLDLTTVGTVRSPFRCRECTFQGGLSGHDVVFDRAVDLSHSKLSAGVDFRGAVFREAALFDRVRPTNDGLQPPVTFALATFEDLASFDGASFPGDLQFLSAKFSATTSFVTATFAGTTTFNGASFEGAMHCRACTFAKTVTFARSTFGRAAAFTGSQFTGPATFDYASAGAVDFIGTTFLDEASFFAMDSTGTVKFTNADFFGLTIFNNFTATHLFFDLDDVGRIDGEEHQRRMLQFLEQDSRARGDVAFANEARYRYLTLSSRRLGPVPRFLDVVVYRGVFGYLVRPLRPALILLGLIALLSLVSVIRSARPGAVPGASAGTAARRRGRARVVQFLDESQDRLVRIPSFKFRAEGEANARIGSWLEFVVAKVLLVGVLLGLANSNETLRKMLDALI